MKTNASILIENYELTGCHGVNPEEKTEAQRFVFSAVLDVDATVAANTDDVDKTVSYSAVCKLIKANELHTRPIRTIFLFSVSTLFQPLRYLQESPSSFWSLKVSALPLSYSEPFPGFWIPL